MTKRDAFHAVLFGLSIAAAVVLYVIGEDAPASGLVLFATGLAMRSPFTRDGEGGPHA
jgi:hypothetical protein